MNRRIIRFVLGFVTVTFILILFSNISTNMSTAQEGALPPLKIVQIGDSYSAGNGARSESGFRNYRGVSGCYRSPTNWGSQFAQSLGDVFAVTYVNRACSGGVIDEIRYERDMEDTDLKNISGSCPSPEYPDEEFYKDTSTLSCSRFLYPQINAIDSSTDLVLMTMGGNDGEFATIVKECFTVFRDPASCRKAVDYAHSQLGNVEDRLLNTFVYMREEKLRPDAKVVLVAYPYLSTDVELAISKSGDTYEVAQEVRALELEADERQRAAVVAANNDAGEEYIVFYDDTKDLFQGHEPDPSAYSQNPDRWLHECETHK